MCACRCVVHACVCLRVCVCVCVSACLSVCLFVCKSVGLFSKRLANSASLSVPVCQPAYVTCDTVAVARSGGDGAVDVVHLDPNYSP